MGLILHDFIWKVNNPFNYRISPVLNTKCNHRGLQMNVRFITRAICRIIKALVQERHESSWWCVIIFIELLMCQKEVGLQQNVWIYAGGAGGTWRPTGSRCSSCSRLNLVFCTIWSLHQQGRSPNSHICIHQTHISIKPCSNKWSLSRNKIARWEKKTQAYVLITDVVNL